MTKIYLQSEDEFMSHNAKTKCKNISTTWKSLIEWQLKQWHHLEGKVETCIRGDSQKYFLTIFLCKVSSSESPRDKRHRLNFILWRTDGELKVKWHDAVRRIWLVWLFVVVQHLWHTAYTASLPVIDSIDVDILFSSSGYHQTLSHNPIHELQNCDSVTHTS